MQKIKVRYIGKNDLITCEYNGVKYNFSKANSIQIIPVEVLQHWNSDTNPYRNEIIPYQDDAIAEKEQKKQTMAEEVEKIGQDVAEMQGKPLPEPQPLPSLEITAGEQLAEIEDKAIFEVLGQKLPKKKLGGRPKGSKNK